LTRAYKQIYEDIWDIKIPGNSLNIAVYDTNTGDDLRAQADADVVASHVRMITLNPVNWEQATMFPSATHILDFGLGSISGLGVLTNRNKDGAGVRIILAGAIRQQQ
jgi:fatty acid synthase subunit beta, fungi type